MTAHPEKSNQQRSFKHKRDLEVADLTPVSRNDQAPTAHTSSALAVDGKRMLSVDEFCYRYGIGRTMAYDEIKFGRLHTVKRGGRRLIPVDAAEAWANGQFPTVGADQC